MVQLEASTVYNKLILVLVLMCLFHASTFAVDGYKEFKFGMSKSTVKSLSPIPLTETTTKGICTLDGDDFPFGLSKVQIYFNFIKGKLLSINITLPNDGISAIVNMLKEKYGDASSSSSSKALGTVGYSPNTEAFIAYDDNTVFLKIRSDESMALTYYLIYRSPEYDKSYNQLQQDSYKGAF